MIRKAVIVVLALGAVGMTVIEITSFRPRDSRFDSDIVFQSEILSVSSRDGVLRLVLDRCRKCDRYGTHTSTCMAQKWEVLVNSKPATLSDIRLGKLQWRVGQTTTRRYYRLSVPTLSAVALLATYPTIAFIRGPLRRWRRRKRGECLNCGYNLTGNVTGVCSECGTKIEAP